ncbi:MAG: M28 family peptidase [Vicingaceae bacterium]|nr:M28 family peptidase [Vicingaceae bacterium]
MKILFFLSLYCISTFSFTQDISYAKKVLDTLTSPYFEGRGAINDGEKKAATYIAQEFEKLGVQPFKNSYFQYFKTPINTIYGDLSVAIDGEKLQPGVDFIVGANSGKLKGTFDLVHYNAANLPSKKTMQKLSKRNFFLNKFIVIDGATIPSDNETLSLLKINVVGATGVIFLEDKLTQSLATTYVDYAILKVKREKINRKSHSISVTIQQKLVSDYQSQNVIGHIKGTEFPDSLVAITAHYDHLGRMGDEVYFPGANDNGSGIALMLNFAAHYTQHPPKKTIVFMAFGAEESGILGSNYFIQHPLFNLQQLNFLINVDVIGTGEEGLMVVNGIELSTAFDKLQTINTKNQYVTTIKKRKNAPNSDHYWFIEKGIPAFFIYGLGSRKAYHDVEDIASTLPMNEFNNIFLLLRDFIDGL